MYTYIFYIVNGLEWASWDFIKRVLVAAETTISAGFIFPSLIERELSSIYDRFANCCKTGSKNSLLVLFHDGLRKLEHGTPNSNPWWETPQNDLFLKHIRVMWLKERWKVFFRLDFLGFSEKMWDLNRLISILKRWRNEAFLPKETKNKQFFCWMKPSTVIPVADHLRSRSCLGGWFLHRLRMWKKHGMFVGYLTYWPYLPLLFLPKKGGKNEEGLILSKKSARFYG